MRETSVIVEDAPAKDLGNQASLFKGLTDMPEHLPQPPRSLFRRLHPQWFLRLAVLCLGILAAGHFFHSYEQAARKHFLETVQSNSTVAADYGVLHRSYVATRRAQAMVSASYVRLGHRNIYVDVGLSLSKHRRLRWQSWVRLQPYLQNAALLLLFPWHVCPFIKLALRERGKGKIKERERGRERNN